MRTGLPYATTALAAGMLLTAALRLTALPALAGEPVARLITTEDDLLGGYGAQGQIGDFLLTNGDVAVIIEAVDHVHGDGLSGGNILDAAVPPYWTDEFGYHVTMLVDFPRQAVYDTVYVEHDGTGGTAVVLAHGVDSGNADLEITTRYSLEADAQCIEVETTILNHGAYVSGYTAGDAFNWEFGTHFVPGYGFNVTGQTTYSAWLGALASGTAYGCTVESGTLAAQHGDLWSDPIIFSGNITAGGSKTFRRHFVVGALGLASISDVSHELQGILTGSVEGTITDDDTGLPIIGATISCDVEGSAIYTQAISDTLGHYSATLYAGNYNFAASVPSYLSDEKEGSIATYGVTQVDFDLVPGTSGDYVADTLTVVSRPILAIPAMLTAGETFTIEAEAPQSTTNWAASIRLGGNVIPLTITDSEYRATYLRWFITARVPTGTKAELYDLIVSASGDVYDEVVNAVAVKQEIPTDFYFIHMTDTHLPTHLFFHDEGAESDTTEMDDLRAVIRDINLINPAFVLFTGDVVNEGELEDFLNWRSYTKAKRLLGELEVPVYIVAGNHDVGGWESTPPPDGTARWNWWRFFGWRRLYDPPPAEPRYTQNYSFDYGGAHFVGLEAYDNYDNWRYWYYGRESFTTRQISWMTSDISTVDVAMPVIAFYHYDFGGELMLDYYGIDCGLYGHIHRDRGSLTGHPLNIATDNLCDGSRSYRLVRVSDGAVLPTATLRAGSNGQNLYTVYNLPNDGTQTSMIAEVHNAHENREFEHGLVKFHVRADSIPYAVEGGELLQTIVDGDVATCYVGVDMIYGTSIVSIEPSTWIPDGSVALLRQSRPNPARTGTTIQFVLGFPAEVTLDIFDVAGRKVATLEDGPLDGGPQESTWDLKDHEGNDVASGVYFYRLRAGGEELTDRLVVVR